MKVKYFQHLVLNLFENRKEAGKEAGTAVEKKIIETIEKKGKVRIIFAAAVSQNEMLDYLSKSKNIDWSKVHAFNMDEYLGMDQENPKSFSFYLYHRLFKKTEPINYNLLNGKNSIPQEIERYTKVLNEAPIDIVCFGIGENGHLAFNDPPLAEFNDSSTVKEVKLNERCRIQQVNEECFDNIDEVPKRALTITIPTIMSAKTLIGVVTGKNKREAVLKTLEGPLSKECPASIIRNHPDCTLFIDKDAYHKSF